jgi:hypothetical protein
MNNIAISPYIAMYALQIQNVKRNSSKTANINELNKKEQVQQQVQEQKVEEVQNNIEIVEEINTIQNKTI